MLEIDRISKTFFPETPNEVRALQKVSLTIEPGSFVVVIGGNGSGKSTLLNAIAGTFPIDAGAIRLAGQEITHWSEHRRARYVGRVFQNPFSGTAPNMTIAENLVLAERRGKVRGLGPALSPTHRSELHERIRRMGLGLEGRLESPMGTLSGGQRQSLTLLMASFVRPDLLLLDEHTAALDPRSAEQVMRLTDQIVGADRLTTLMVTHSMQHATQFGDRLIMMVRGRIVHDDRGAEKKRLRPEDLLARFEEIRRAEQLDESASAMLREQYV
jgi:putative ABC transport system ATP-binding protein